MDRCDAAAVVAAGVFKRVGRLGSPGSAMATAWEVPGAILIDLPLFFTVEFPPPTLLGGKKKSLCVCLFFDPLV